MRSESINEAVVDRSVNRHILSTVKVIQKVSLFSAHDIPINFDGNDFTLDTLLIAFVDFS